MSRVLHCDPSSISFTPDGEPIFSSDSTRAAIVSAADYVQSGVPVAFPTETVYGLGASAFAHDAVAKVFEIKGRPADNPLIVHISSMQMLYRLIPSDFEMPLVYTALIQHFWPGPLSLIFPANRDVPPIVTAGHPTVAIRMPSHSISRALIATSRCPIAAPSANASGRPSPTKADHVLRDLDGKVRALLDGGSCTIGLESTVVDGVSHKVSLRVLRPGGVNREDLRSCLDASNLGEVEIKVHRRDYLDAVLENAPTTPGMKYQHYSPSVPVVLLITACPPAGMHRQTLAEIVKSLTPQSFIRKFKFGLMCNQNSFLIDAAGFPEVALQRYDLGTPDKLSVMASRLYDGFHELEKDGVDCILVEGVEEVEEGLAIMNRVTKAATDMRWVLP